MLAAKALSGNANNIAASHEDFSQTQPDRYSYQSGDDDVVKQKTHDTPSRRCLKRKRLEASPVAGIDVASVTSAGDMSEIEPLTDSDEERRVKSVDSRKQRATNGLGNADRARGHSGDRRSRSQRNSRAPSPATQPESDVDEHEHEHEPQRPPKRRRSVAASHRQTQQESSASESVAPSANSNASINSAICGALQDAMRNVFPPPSVTANNANVSAGTASAPRISAPTLASKLLSALQSAPSTSRVPVTPTGGGLSAALALTSNVNGGGGGGGELGNDIDRRRNSSGGTHKRSSSSLSEALMGGLYPQDAGASRNAHDDLKDARIDGVSTGSISGAPGASSGSSEPQPQVLLPREDEAPMYPQNLAALAEAVAKSSASAPPVTDPQHMPLMEAAKDALDCVTSIAMRFSFGGELSMKICDLMVKNQVVWDLARTSLGHGSDGCVTLGPSWYDSEINVPQLLLLTYVRYINLIELFDFWAPNEAFIVRPGRVCMRFWCASLDLCSKYIFSHGIRPSRFAVPGLANTVALFPTRCTCENGKPEMHSSLFFLGCVVPSWHHLAKPSKPR